MINSALRDALTASRTVCLASTCNQSSPTQLTLARVGPIDWPRTQTRAPRSPGSYGTFSFVGLLGDSLLATPQGHRMRPPKGHPQRAPKGPPFRSYALVLGLHAGGLVVAASGRCGHTDINQPSSAQPFAEQRALADVDVVHDPWGPGPLLPFGGPLPNVFKMVFA